MLLQMQSQQEQLRTEREMMTANYHLAQMEQSALKKLEQVSGRVASTANQ
jgi:hypothetical protein